MGDHGLHVDVLYNFINTLTFIHSFKMNIIFVLTLMDPLKIQNKLKY